MTRRERIEAAFRKERTDRVPVAHVSASSDVAAKLLGREAWVGFGIQQWREARALWEGPDAHAEFLERSYADLLAVNQAMGNDLYRMLYPRYNRRPTKKIDAHTFLYEYGEEKDWKILRHDPSQEHYGCVYDYVERPSLTLEMLEDRVAAQERALERPSDGPALAEDDMSLRGQRELGDAIVFRMSGGGIHVPREQAWLESVVLRPDLVARELDVQVEQTRRSIPKLAAEGFRYFFGGGDFAGYQGPFYSPKAFHELVLPRLRQAAQVIHDNGGKLLFASDGNLWPVADDLFAASGVDAFYEIDRRAGMDLRKLRERFPDLTLVGNINCHNLHVGTREEVVEETMSCLEAAKELGGIIVGLTNLPMPGTPLENLEAMLETIEANR
jgi:hypothetical protein